METAAILLLAAAAAAFVLAPVLRKDALEEDRSRAVPGELADLLAEREMILAGLRDLEDDRDTGKVGEQDYGELRARLSARAVEILKRLDELGETVPSGARAEDPARGRGREGDGRAAARAR